MRIFVGCATHQYGATMFSAHSEAKLIEQVADWCRTYWPLLPKNPYQPKNNLETIQQYFEECDEEFHMGECDLEDQD